MFDYKARGSLPGQQDCCPECLVSFLDFDAGQLLLLGLFGCSPLPTPHSRIPQFPTPRVACETVNYSVFIQGGGCTVFPLF